jgi:hypothetical protein
MAQRGDSKAINLTKPTEDTRRKMQCPHPFCFEEIFGHRRDVMIHFQDKHKCGRCNHGKHHKCKKDICGCGCRWGDPSQETYDVATLNKLMGMAFQRPKIDGEKLNAEVAEQRKAFREEVEEAFKKK